MSRMRVMSAALAAACLVNGAAQADTITLDALKDNTLYQFPGISNGAGEYLFAGVTKDGELRRGLIQFDIAAVVPTGATIQSVKLGLWMSRVLSATPEVTLHRSLASWGEGTSNAPLEEGSGTIATTGDATWFNRFHPGTPWTNPGGDFVATASAAAFAELLFDWTYWESAGMVTDVQLWLDNPSQNFGWVILGDETSNLNAVRFNTRENVTFGNTPVLEITYTMEDIEEPPPVIPEPTTVALLGVASLALLRRSRR